MNDQFFTMTNKVLCSGLVVTLMSIASVANAELFVDFNDRDQSTLTQSGWNAFEIDGINTQTTQTYGAISVTVSDTNGVLSNPSLDDRVRNAPTNGGGITLSDMLRDFVMSDNNPQGTGLNVLVEGLIPNQLYEGRIWSYDDAAAKIVNNPKPTFIADWTANGILIADDYDSGSHVPTTDNEKSFYFQIAADGDGKIFFQALRTPESIGSAGVINGLFLQQVPEPETAALFLLMMLGVAGFYFRRQRVK